MCRVPDGDVGAVHYGGPGTFCWMIDGPNRSLYLYLPTAGVGSWAIHPHKLPNGHSWMWDEDEDCPTLWPSLHVTSGNESIWHGYVHEGRLT